MHSNIRTQRLHVYAAKHDFIWYRLLAMTLNSLQSMNNPSRSNPLGTPVFGLSCNYIATLNEYYYSLKGTKQSINLHHKNKHVSNINYS